MYSRKDKVWKLSDFGITSEGTSIAFRSTDGGRGTAGYRAPEVILESKSAFNNKVDIWALGCILFELATGKSPFNSDGVVLEHYRTGASLNLDWDGTFDEATQDAISKSVHDMVHNQSHLRPSALTLHQEFLVNHKREEVSAQLIAKFEQRLNLSASVGKDDGYYTRSFEMLSEGLRSWAVSIFASPTPQRYPSEPIEKIRAVLETLKKGNDSVPEVLMWKDVDLQRVLSDSEFRISFVQHVVALTIHENIFSPFTYLIEDFGLQYWLKRYCDQVGRLGISHFVLFLIMIDLDETLKHEWSRIMLIAGPEIFDKKNVQGRIFRRIKSIIRHIQPKPSLALNEAIYGELWGLIETATEISISMRLEKARFISSFPISGAVFLAARHYVHGAEDLQQVGSIRMCLFPGIIKQNQFLGASKPTGISIIKARVLLQTKFEYLKLDENVVI